MSDDVEMIQLVDPELLDSAKSKINFILREKYGCVFHEIPEETNIPERDNLLEKFVGKFDLNERDDLRFRQYLEKSYKYLNSKPIQFGIEKVEPHTNKNFDPYNHWEDVVKEDLIELGFEKDELSAFDYLVKNNSFRTTFIASAQPLAQFLGRTRSLPENIQAHFNDSFNRIKNVKVERFDQIKFESDDQRLNYVVGFKEAIAQNLRELDELLSSST